jgi:hypothetical protein
MKTPSRFFQMTLALLAMVTFFSCEKNTESGFGKAEFSANLSAEGLQKSLSLDDSTIVSWYILVSIEDMEGNMVVTDKMIPLFVFGNGFVSEKLEIKAGEYKLVKFMVINSTGEVLFASPLEGSPLAYLVDKPLPISFQIYPNQVTTIAPEVLEVGDHTPGHFGYVNFGVQIIHPLDFYVVCILDNPLIMAPTQLTTANLTVFGPDFWHYTFPLKATINHLVIRGGGMLYEFLLEKEGYTPQKFTFTSCELKATTRGNPLVLKIPWDTNYYQRLVLQPGPEEGKDAMVSNLDPNKNFGDYKYFEATFLSEPILTVMRSNRSLIQFALDQLPKAAVIKKVQLQLFYDVPLPWDSTVVIGNNGAVDSIWYGAVLQQITAPWEENSVTWNSQPATTEANQVYLSPFVRNVNYIEVDVTQLFISSNTAIPATYGMLFKLYPTEKFPGFRFASSDYPEPSMRPKLTIYYTEN